MFEYITDEALDLLDQSDHAVVREGAQNIRALAGELLLARMRELGIRYLQDAAAPGLARLLWQAVQEGPKVMSETEVTELANLSRLAGGWWRPNHLDIQELVPLDDWRNEYAEPSRV
jgi:hypothetical protein